jgi:Zn finger protein HypA/HybF involved in hydrogenase expression
MDLTTLLYLTGSSGFFSSRAFIPAFFTAVFLRYGQYFPMLGDLEFIQATGAEPTWFTHNLTIMGLGLLAMLEVGATKIPEAQEALDSVHNYAKSGLAAVTAMGILSTKDIAFIEETISQAGVFDMVASGGLAVAVFFFSSLRSGFMEMLAMSDPDDALGIRGLISWFEDLWSSFGLFLLILYPIFILILLGIVLGLLFLARKYAEYREARSRVSCPTCQELVYACAPTCPKCHSPQSNLKDVGFFGQTVDRPALEGLDHEFRLISKRRCPKCATRVTERKLPQNCPTCKNAILSDPGQQQAYISQVRARLPMVLGVTFVLSLIPVLGIIPGIIYYRIQLIAPFRAYIPGGKGLMLRWLVKLIFILLIALQLVPGLGGFMVPAMALISYGLYSSYFSSMLSD